MKPHLSLQELSIVIAVRGFSPTLLTVDFLKYSGIIPIDWELARSPIINSQVSQVSFTSGVNVVAQMDSIIFSEVLDNKIQNETQESKMIEIAHKYIEVLPNADYQAIIINPRIFLSFPDLINDNSLARYYIVNNFLSSGISNQASFKPTKAEILLTYTLAQRQLKISICEANLQLSNQPSQVSVLLSGSFVYEIFKEAISDRISQLHEFINNWQVDLKDFQKVILNHFIVEATVLSKDSLTGLTDSDKH